MSTKEIPPKNFFFVFVNLWPGMEMPGRAWRYVATNEKIIAKQDIQWKLITKFAPWMGVFNVRLVGVTIRASEKP